MQATKTIPDRRTLLHPASWGALLAVLLLTAGCKTGSPLVSLDKPARHYRAGDYEAVLERWTRSEKIINIGRLDTPLRVFATCMSPDFIDAYVAHQDELFKISGRERDAMLQALMESWEQEFTFVVFMATTDTKWNDLDQKDSIWRVALVNDLEQQVIPTEVKRQRRVTATTSEFFPHFEPFYRMYTLRYPRKMEDGRPLVTEKTRSFSLRFAGPLGSTLLTWRLR